MLLAAPRSCHSRTILVQTPYKQNIRVACPKRRKIHERPYVEQVLGCAHEFVQLQSEIKECQDTIAELSTQLESFWYVSFIIFQCVL